MASAQISETIRPAYIWSGYEWIPIGDGGGSGSAFLNIQTNPATQTIVADSTTDTLTLVSGSNIYINSDSSTDSITIGVTGIQEQIDNLITSIGPSSASATASRITAYVKNGSTALAKGVPVYVTGADGTNIIVGPASNASESTSSKTLGFTQTALSSNQHGYIVLEGLLTGLNTNGATAGDPIWLGETPGTVIYGLINKPQAPNHLVYLGVVSRANSSNGEIFVKIQNGFELKELHDVRINGVANDDLIVYNSASSIWVNSPKQNIINTASAAAFNSASANTVSQINALTTSDIEEGSRLYYTDERAQDAIGTILGNGLTYNDSAPGISVNPGAMLNEIVDGTSGNSYGLVGTSQYLDVKNTNGYNKEIELDILSVESKLVTDGFVTNSTSSTMFVHGNHTNITAAYNSASNQIILTGTAGGGGGDGASVIYSTEQPDTSQLTIGDIWIDSNASVSTGIVNPHGFGYITTTPETQQIQENSDFDNLNIEAGTSISINAASATSTLTISSIITNLNSLIDTTIASPSNNQVLAYNSSSTQWTNQNIMNILSTANASATYLTVTAASTTYEPNIAYNSASPSGIATGQLWIDTTDAAAPILKVYNGSTWVDMSGAGGGFEFDTLLLMGV